MKTMTAKLVLVAVVVLGGGVAMAQEAAQVPTYELRQPKLDLPADTGYSFLAGLADLGMRTVESGVEAGIFLVGLGDEFSNPSSSGAYVYLGVDALLLLGAPAIEALVCSWIGDSSHRHPLAPLMITSYTSHVAVDALTVALAGTSYAGLVYILGSALGSAAMGAVHAASAQPLASAVAMQTAVVFQRVPPVAAPQGATFRF